MLNMDTLVSRSRELLSELSAQAAPPARTSLDAGELAAMIDHTALKPETTPEMITRLCQEAREYGFASVCVNSTNVPQCVAELEGTGIPVCSVVGFPLGASLTAVKAYETSLCIKAGAQEIDMVLNVGGLKAGNYTLVRDDIASVAQTCRPDSATLKVIIEACLLTDLEKVIACLLAVDAGADYVKTSTGMNAGGATTEDVTLMRGIVGPEIGVKAAGGIRTYEAALAMISAGANRIGASAGIAIVQGSAA
jgi:deoxyribose-phosphate aldolase